MLILVRHLPTRQDIGSMTLRLRTLQMPNPAMDDQSLTEVSHSGVVVVVGANGAGKSRFGTWLENPKLLINPSAMPQGNANRAAYRIGAQRLLGLPDQASRLAAERANAILWEGNEVTHSGSGSRVQGDPVVGQTNDFGALVNALFAERHKRASEYYELAKNSEETQGRPLPDKLDCLKDLWNSIFPERLIVIGDHSISARATNGSNPGDSSTYPAGQLSDGERVGFYLIGHVLMAPENACIVIDEPELHLHSSIQSRLWNKLEISRPDCTFVYITHDLAFAASRKGAPIIVLFDYAAPPREQSQTRPTNSQQEPPSVGVWKWMKAPGSDFIPREIVLRIMGTRRPTLFVEGSRTSLDLALYEVLLPDKYIVPTGSCEFVQRATRVFRNIQSLHHIEPTGLIDRDDRDDSLIQRLQSEGIYTLPVAGVENLLALPECIKAYMDSIGIAPDQQHSRLLSAQERVRQAMVRLRNKVIAERAQYAIRGRLQSMRSNGNSLADLKRAFDRVIVDAGPEAIFAEVQAFIDVALQPTTDFAQILAVFRNKSILAHIASEFRVSRRTYRDALITLLQSNAGLRLSIRQRLAIPIETIDNTPIGAACEEQQAHITVVPIISPAA